MNIGGIAAKVATGMGFQKGDDVLETLKDGSIFTDILQEHWRHQLLKYDIISFWGSMDNVSMLGHSLERYSTMREAVIQGLKVATVGMVVF